MRRLFTVLLTIAVCAVVTLSAALPHTPPVGNGSSQPPSSSSSESGKKEPPPEPKPDEDTDPKETDYF